VRLRRSCSKVGPLDSCFACHHGEGKKSERERSGLVRSESAFGMSFAYGFRAEADPAKPVVTRCGYCDFKTEGQLEQARAAFEAHECGRPKPDPVKRRPRGFRFRGDPWLYERSRSLVRSLVSDLDHRRPGQDSSTPAIR
jgi:hypothetical protein